MRKIGVKKIGTKSKIDGFVAIRSVFTCTEVTGLEHTCSGKLI